MQPKLEGHFGVQTLNSLSLSVGRFCSEYQLGPRFAEHNSPEYIVCQEWGKLLQNERIQRDKLEQQLQEARSDMDRKVEQFRFQERNMLIRMRQWNFLTLDHQIL